MPGAAGAAGGKRSRTGSATGRSGARRSDRPRPRRLVLAVIDGMKSTMLERAVAAGGAPALELMMRRGVYIDDCVAAFPSVTPVCAATIATGVGQDRHLIPSMNWYHRAEGRYVEYGSSMSAARRFGVTRQLTDTVYNMNRVHLAADVPTVFEALDDAGRRTAGTTYLMYRGRHRHEVSRETALTRLASTLFRHPVMGPREFFYADIFASRRTGCRSQLGMPGVRDRHTGCVGAYLVEHDLFDFLLFSLPDNDSYSHRRGPEAQEHSISQADRQLTRLMEAAGGPEEFLEDHAVIVVADHSHAQVEQAALLADAFSEFIVLQPGERRSRDAEIALCPASRAALIYVLVEQGRRALLPRLLDCALQQPAVDLVMWRENGDAFIAGERGRLRFSPGGGVSDLRGGRWHVTGELEALQARVEGNVFLSEAYPDALARCWSALSCSTSGDLLLSAAPGWEFYDWGGVAHVGAGAHGSLHCSDSLGPLIFCGTGPGDRSARAQWSIADVMPAALGHFGLAHASP